MFKANPEERRKLIKQKEELQNKFTEEFSMKWRDYFIGRMEQCNDRSSKYFFKRVNCIPGAITRLFNSVGELETSDKEILKICEKFYTKLFEDKEITSINEEETLSFTESPKDWSFNDSDSTLEYSDSEKQNKYFTFNEDIPYAFLPDEKSLKIDKENQEKLDEPITVEELYEALKGMKKEKSPGLDGLPVEFYQKIFPEVKGMLYNSLMHAFERGELSCTQKRGVIKLIPKPNKNPNYVNHARPITLLNVDVKILARCLALRLTNVVRFITTTDQKGFVKGRQMGANILDVYSIIAAAEEGNSNDKNMLLFLDIEKAYDTIKWRFITTVLERLGFPSSFIKWFEVLQKNREIRVYNNGHSSAPITPSRGLAQGSGLSPFIFIIAMSRLGAVINRDEKIQGIKYGNIEKKCDMAADDTVLFVKGTKENLEEIRRVLKSFGNISGLKVNYEKSVAMRLGNWEKGEEINVERNLKWAERTRYLGVIVTKKIDRHLIDRQFQITPERIQQIVSGLRYRNNSLIGQILILKSLVLSTFVYKFTHYPRPNMLCLKKMNSVFSNFVWSNGRHKLNQKQMEKRTNAGGFNMVNLMDQQFCWRVRWITEALKNEGQEERSFWEHYLELNISIQLKDFVRCNISSQDYHKLIHNWNTFPVFWKTLFSEWFKRSFESRDQGWTIKMWRTGFLFNKAIGEVTIDTSLKCYNRLQKVGIFTCEELAIAWEHLTQEDKNEINQCYSEIQWQCWFGCDC